MSSLLELIVVAITGVIFGISRNISFKITGKSKQKDKK